MTSMRRMVMCLPSLALRLTTLLALALLVVPLRMVQPAQAAPSAQTTSFRFVVAGDSRGSNNGINATILSELVQATIKEGAKFILMPGDQVTGSSTASTLESQLINFRETVVVPLYNAGIGVYVVRGNHDTGSVAVWDSVFSGPYALPGNGPSGEEDATYSFTYGNVRVIALDEYFNSGRVNQAWLNAQLAANTQQHVFVFGHMPAFSAYHTDTLASYPTNRPWIQQRQ